MWQLAVGFTLLQKRSFCNKSNENVWKQLQRDCVFQLLLYYEKNSAAVEKKNKKVIKITHIVAV